LRHDGDSAADVKPFALSPPTYPPGGDRFTS
jgi:hypothetical protein